MSDTLQSPLSINHSILKTLCARNTPRTFVHLFACIGIYAACVWALASPFWWIKPVACFLQATILLGFTSIIHECIHGLFAREKWPNRWIGSIAAAVLLKNYTLHRAFHLRHHSVTTQEDDPEPRAVLRTFRDYLRLVSRRGNILFTTRVSWQDSWRVLRGKVPEYMKQKELSNVRIDVVIECLWLGAVVTSLLLWPKLTFYGYVIPLAISVVLCFFVFLPEHYETTIGSGLAVENTRTIHSNPIFRFLFWNNNYHAEHHAYPGVPFFHLRRVHNLISTHIRHTVPSYTQFHVELIRRLRSKDREHKDAPARKEWESKGYSA
jgi:fatty acid desaturase